MPARLRRPHAAGARDRPRGLRDARPDARRRRRRGVRQGRAAARARLSGRAGAVEAGRRRATRPRSRSRPPRASPGWTSRSRASRPRCSTRSATSGEEETQRRAADLAACYEHAIVEALIARVERALDGRAGPRLAIGGGVAANRLLRERAAGARRRGPRAAARAVHRQRGDDRVGGALGASRCRFPDYLDLDAYATGRAARRLTSVHGWRRRHAPAGPAGRAARRRGARRSPSAARPARAPRGPGRVGRRRAARPARAPPPLADPVPYDGRSPAPPAEARKRVLVELPRPALGELPRRSDDERRALSAPTCARSRRGARRCGPRSAPAGSQLRDASPSAAPGTASRRPSHAATWPRSSLGVRARPVRRFYPATSEPVPGAGARARRPPARRPQGAGRGARHRGRASVAPLRGRTAPGYDAVDRDADPAPGADPRGTAPPRDERHRAGRACVAAAGERVMPIRVASLRATRRRGRGGRDDRRAARRARARRRPERRRRHGRPRRRSRWSASTRRTPASRDSPEAQAARERGGRPRDARRRARRQRGDRRGRQRRRLAGRGARRADRGRARRPPSRPRASS